MAVPHDLRAYADLLMLEIGNSHITVATSIKQQIRTQERFGHDQLDALLDHAEQAWAALPENALKAVIAASVVPPVTQMLREGISRRLGSPTLVIGEDVRRPILLAVESPESVGIDRVCAAAAAYDQIRAACAIASFGTAITIDCVNDEGVFMGGAILPGLALQAKSLHTGTAMLPEVTIQATGSVYGTTTEQAICNGVLYGVTGALREIIERYATDLKVWPRLVATGGNAELVCSQCDFVDNIVPDLCVRGIGLAYLRHFAAFENES